MLLLVIGIVLFIGVHSISMVAEPWRDTMVNRLGPLGWKAIYSVVAIVGFVLLIYGYGIARQNPTVLYQTPEWFRHINVLLMLFVFPLFLAANFPGKIKRAAKHPLLAATKIWAFAHLLVNGTLADVILFGSFLVWAVLNRISMKTRQQRPIMALPESGVNDVICIVGGLGIYAAFVFWLHENWIGVAVGI